LLDKNSVPPEKGKGSKLTTKMENFVNEYFVDLNASAAVLRAGYRTSSPNKMAVKLMNHPLVRTAIDERKEERREKTELTADYVITKLVAIADKTEDLNPQASLRALELLGKHLGLYRDRQEISGPDGEAIQMEQKVKESAEQFTNKLLALSRKADTKLRVVNGDNNDE
jgi:phage terminase small subunit